MPRKYDKLDDKQELESLFSKIRRPVEENCYVVGLHTSERLEERGILEWQVIVGMDDAKLVRQRLRA